MATLWVYLGLPINARACAQHYLDQVDQYGGGAHRARLEAIIEHAGSPNALKAWIAAQTPE
jgi:phosphoribosylcarboxyaminoimidazole (NCAIR) mutase